MSFDRAQQRFDADYPEYLEDGYAADLDDDDFDQAREDRQLELDERERDWKYGT